MECSVEMPIDELQVFHYSAIPLNVRILLHSGDSWEVKICRGMDDMDEMWWTCNLCRISLGESPMAALPTQQPGEVESANSQRAAGETLPLLSLQSRGWIRLSPAPVHIKHPNSTVPTICKFPTKPWPWFLGGGDWHEGIKLAYSPMNYTAIV